MKQARLSTLALALIVAGGSFSLSAGDDQTNEQMQKLYLKLEQVMQGSKPDPTVLLSLGLPGFSVGKGLDTTDSGDLTFLNNVLDSIPSVSGVWSPSGKTYSGVYGSILTTKVLQPDIPLTQDEKNTLAQYEPMLKIDSDQMTAYNKYRVAYNTANDILADADGAVRAGTAKSIKQSLYDNVEYALEDWQNNGFKDDIEAAQDKVNTIRNKTAGSWWTALKRNYDTGMRSSIKTLTFPKPENWGGDSDGWTTFSFKSSDAVTDSKFSNLEVAAAFAYSKGGSGISAEGSFHKVQAKQSFSNASTEMTVSLKRVAVYRNWMDTTVFSNTTYDLPQTNGKSRVISDGADQALNLHGEMPILVTQLLLAKNLVLKGDLVTSVKNQASQDIHAAVNGNFGPFSFNASFDKNDKSADSHLTSDSTSITSDGVQVIGFLCSTVPKCPNLGGGSSKKANTSK